MRKFLTAMAMVLAITGAAAAAALIGEQKATEAAFTHAGVTAANAKVAAFSLIDRAGTAVYDIIFDTIDTGYHYVVDAESGAVIDSSSHARQSSAPDAVSSATGKPQSSGPAKKSSVYDGKRISADRAKEIALTHAGVSENETRKLEIKLDREYGRTVYEIEFKVGSMEYDYDIDAVTGDIIQWHKEYDD